MNWQRVAFDWNQAKAFLATAETGSLSAAARALGLSQPTLSRQVAALEADLGVALFERIGRSLSLTGPGLELVEHVRAMGEAAGRVSLAAAGRTEAIEGRVAISASDVVAVHQLPPILARLRTEAPGIEIEGVAANEISDLQRREADIAIRHVRPEQPDLVARLIRETTAHLYAATSYLEAHGRPTTPDDLGDATFVYPGRSEPIIAALNGLGVGVSRDQFRLSSESGVVYWEMVRRGLGMGLMSRDVAACTPEVEQVLPNLPPIPMPVWLVTHQELRTSRRIRLVFDILAEAIGADPSETR
ncbi:MAG: LysR family transcriptional regulator [Pseudomonadota bacterium]